MVKKFTVLSLLLILAGTAAHAFRPYAKSAEPRASWMTVSSLKTGRQYYMEVAEDGTAITRTETKNTIAVKRGKIPPQLAKDFLREIENSEIIGAHSYTENKLVFYKGELLNISAHINGELKRIDAPLNDFGEAFSLSFDEVKKAAAKKPGENKLKGFLISETLSGTALKEFQIKAAKDGMVKIIETYDFQEITPLLSAIKQPHRLIPLENSAQVSEIQDFVSRHQLYGFGKIFYLPSTRGIFKCQILNAAK